MKNFVWLFGFVILFFSTTVLALGGQSMPVEKEDSQPVVLEVNQHTGETRSVEVNHPVWRGLTKVEQKAHNNPGVEQPVDSKVVWLDRPSFFWVVPITSHTQVVVYDGTMIKTLDNAGEKSGEERFAWYILFCLVAVVFMGISNILMKKGKTDAFAALVAAFAALVVAAAALVALVATAAATTVVALVALVVAFAAALVAAFAADRKVYRFFVAVFYIATAVILGYGWIF
ncbi:hypothetical protein KJ785_04710 [Patescibacteria group bacterium]|nr:hypothetical protein [Patescibacteria group bacterium]